MEGVGPTGRVLSPDQLRKLAQFGEERTAAVGEKLFEIGDATYPLIAILEGEAAILDGGGREVVRHGAAGFLGEMNLLSGQTVFLTAVATEPMRYIAVDRDTLRQLLFDDPELSDLLLSAFVQRRELLQQRQGIGIEILGPRHSDATREMVEFARRMRLPSSWRDPAEDLDFIRRHWSGPLDPRLPKGVTWTSRAVIDACRPFDMLKDFPPVVRASPALRDRVAGKFAAQWKRSVLGR